MHSFHTLAHHSHNQARAFVISRDLVIHQCGIQSELSSLFTKTYANPASEKRSSSCTFVPLRAIHVSKEDVTVISPVDSLVSVVNSEGRRAVDFLVNNDCVALAVHADAAHMGVFTAVDPENIPENSRYISAQRSTIKASQKPNESWRGHTLIGHPEPGLWDS